MGVWATPLLPRKIKAGQPSERPFCMVEPGAGSKSPTLTLPWHCFHERSLAAAPLWDSFRLVPTAPRTASAPKSIFRDLSALCPTHDPKEQNREY